MANNDGSIKIGVSVDESELKSGLKKTEKEAKQTADDVSDQGKKSSKGWKDSFNEIGSLSKKGFSAVSSAAKTAAKASITAIAGVMAAMGGLAAVGIKYNASIETYQTSFEVMTGSAEKAGEVIERLKKVGAETPFELPQLADTTQLLMNYGFTADEAMDKMMMLGDISQGSADKMSRIAMAYGQMSSAGKVQLEDVKQMIEAGFNPLQEISESTGESMESLYQRISDGTLAVDEITASMERATSEGGKYYQSMEKQSKTFEGQMSTLKDNAQQLLGDIMKPISEEMTNSILPAANEALSTLSSAFEEGGLEGMFEAGAGVITNLLNGMSSQLPAIFNTATTILGSLVQGIAAALPSLANAALLVIQQFLTTLAENGYQIAAGGIQLISQLFDSISAKLPELIPLAFQAIANFVNGLISNLPQLWDSGMQLLLSLVQGIVDSIPDLVRQVPTIIANFIGSLIQHLPSILSTGVQLLGELIKGILSAIPSLIAGLGDVVANMIDYIGNIDWLQVGINIIKGIGNGIASMGKWLIDKAVGCVKGAFDTVKGWLGIKSPSRKAKKEIGYNWVEGEAEGLDEKTPELEKAATKSTQAAFDASKKEVASRFVSSAQGRAYDHPASAYVDTSTDTDNSTDEDGPIVINNQFIVDSDVLVDKTTKATIKKISRNQKGKGRYK
ncbi:tape measure protein [Faecalitalea cylindroides]|uniref:tape measure protein n=1 Tax=Faecalitalea cylindroides TaxID=39483 RepID=UPI002E76D722|nr:tape measure protein [Faecalitalea cylindroides]MEE1448551.1 tape measure protein [Faecalitalea cylindroides]